MLRIARGMQEPDLAAAVFTGQLLQHRQQRRNADTGADQRHAPAGRAFQREASGGNAQQDLGSLMHRVMQQFRHPAIGDAPHADPQAGIVRPSRQRVGALSGHRLRVVRQRDGDVLPRPERPDRRLIHRTQHEGNHVGGFLAAFGAGEPATSDPVDPPVILPDARAVQCGRTMEEHLLWNDLHRAG